MAIFAQNMNGIPVYPSPENGERPYPRAPKSQFSTPSGWLVFRLSAHPRTY